MDINTLRLLVEANSLLIEANDLCKDWVTQDIIRSAKTFTECAIREVSGNNFESVNGGDDVEHDGHIVTSTDDVSTEDDEYLAQFNPDMEDAPDKGFVGLTADGDEVYSWFCYDSFGNKEGYFDITTGGLLEIDLIGWRYVVEGDFETPVS